MELLNTAREAAALAQARGDIELRQKLLDLQQQALAIVDELQTAKRETQALRDKASIHASLTFRGNTYWQGETGPFCSRCWDADSRLVRLHTRQGYLPSCPECKRTAPNPDAPPPKAGLRFARSPYLSR